MGTTRFSNPQALSSALAVTRAPQLRTFGLLNRVVPLVSVPNLYLAAYTSHLGAVILAKQVNSAIGIKRSDHNKEVAALDSGRYRQISLQVCESSVRFNPLHSQPDFNPLCTIADLIIAYLLPLLRV